MKSLQILLFIAILASIIPSTVVICSKESAKATFTPIKSTRSFISKNQDTLMNYATTIGSYGICSTLVTSYYLTKVKRSLNNARNLTPIRKLLNQGIKTNKIALATSLSAVLIPFAIKNSAPIKK